jgi:hypothetical protein
MGSSRAMTALAFEPRKERISVASRNFNRLTAGALGLVINLPWE